MRRGRLLGSLGRNLDRSVGLVREHSKQTGGDQQANGCHQKTVGSDADGDNARMDGCRKQCQGPDRRHEPQPRDGRRRTSHGPSLPAWRPTRPPETRPSQEAQIPTAAKRPYHGNGGNTWAEAAIAAQPLRFHRPNELARPGSLSAATSLRRASSASISRGPHPVSTMEPITTAGSQPMPGSGSSRVCTSVDLSRLYSRSMMIS